MTTTLFQKHPLKGKRSFELDEEAVNVNIDMPFLKKEFTVVLSILDPEPVIKGSTLAFVSTVNRKPLVEMFVNKPDPQSFNAFVDQLKQAAIKEAFGRPNVDNAGLQVSAEQCQLTLDMLTTYLSGDEYTPLLESLRALRDSPQDRDKLEAMFAAFNALGPMQGAVLTYAPYINSLISGEIPDTGPG